MAIQGIIAVIGLHHKYMNRTDIYRSSNGTKLNLNNVKTVIPTFNKYFIVTESNDLYSVLSSFTNDTVLEFIMLSPIEIETAPALRENDANLTEAYILDESGEVQSVVSGGKFVKIQPDNEYVMGGNKISVKNVFEM